MHPLEGSDWSHRNLGPLLSPFSSHMQFKRASLLSSNWRSTPAFKNQRTGRGSCQLPRPCCVRVILWEHPCKGQAGALRSPPPPAQAVELRSSLTLVTAGRLPPTGPACPTPAAGLGALSPEDEGPHLWPVSPAPGVSLTPARGRPGRWQVCARVGFRWGSLPRDCEGPPVPQTCVCAHQSIGCINAEGNSWGSFH